MTAEGVIDSVEELIAIANRNEKLTFTYRVTREVAEANNAQIRRKGGAKLRLMTDSEIRELADYVEADFEEMCQAKPEIGQTSCPKCGRTLTFTDLIHEAASIGKHDKKFMGEVLLGKHGHVITVNGTDDDTHVFRCLRCGDRTVRAEYPNSPTPAPCYKAGCTHGGYAHCGY